MAYDTIDDAEVADQGPASYVTARKLRDNPIAMFAGDDTGETAPRLQPGAFRNPAASTAVTIAKTVRAWAPPTRFSRTDTIVEVVVAIPGVYTFNFDTSGSGSNDTIIYLNDVADLTQAGSASVSHQITCANGDYIKIVIDKASSTSHTVSNFEITADVCVPLAMCRYKEVF